MILNCEAPVPFQPAFQTMAFQVMLAAEVILVAEECSALSWLSSPEAILLMP